MADKKISQLTDLPAASVSPSNDVLAIVDTNVTETKKITAKALVDGALNAGTANGLVFLNGSKETTTGSIITYDGTTFKVDDAVVINESGGDNDTRIEGDTDANLFFVDASADKIGIGTNTPGEKLDVAGEIRRLNDSPGGFTVKRTDGVNSNGSLNFVGSDDVVDGSVRMATDAANSLTFLTAATERLRIDSSGNLGLGVTPSAWGSIFNAMQLGDGGFIAGRSDVAIQLQLGCNGFYDGVDFKYIVTGTAARYYMDTGAHYWENAASGTAGNTITFTTAMTLDASGNLGVGTTSPANLLHINGSNSIARFSGASTSLSAYQTFFNNSAAQAYFGIESSTGTGIIGTGAAYGMVLTTASTNPLVFGTNNAERARITAGGFSKFSNVGTYADVNGAYHEVRSNQDGNTFVVGNTSTNTNTDGTIFIQNARNTTNNTYYIIGAYNTAAAAFKFRVADSGDVTNTNNSYGAISDEKVKQDIVDAASQWDDIKGLRIRKFRYKADSTAPLQIGLVAQEAEIVSPGIVDEHPDYEEVEVTDEEGNVTKDRQPTGTVTKSVKYSVLYMKAIKALQEAMTRIEELEAKVAALEAK